MALSTITVTHIDHHFDGKRIHFKGSFVFSASPDTYATGGNAISFKGLPGVPGNPVPIIAWIESKNGNQVSYDVAAQKVKLFTANATELTAAAIPAGVSGDTFYVEAEFKNR